MTPAILIDHVIKSYPHPETGIPVTILDIPEWTIQKNDHIGIEGPSGGGKSTLLNILAGLTTPDSGEVYMLETPLFQLKEAARDRFRANNIGVVYQSFHLLPAFTALENVQLGMMFASGKKDRSHAEHVLEQVGLKDRMQYKPGQLSIGQQQRVSIARAIVNNPAILLADEPTGNLDPTIREEVLQLLFDISKNRVLLLVSHDEQTLSHFSQRVSLKTLNKAMAGVS